MKLKLKQQVLDNYCDGYENVTLKAKSRCFNLYRADSISFNWNVGKFFWIWILKNFIKVQETKKKVVVECSRPPLRNVKLDIAENAKKFTKKRDARAKLLFWQSKPIGFSPFSLTSPSSLLKFPIDNPERTVCGRQEEPTFLISRFLWRMQGTFVIASFV